MTRILTTYKLKSAVLLFSAAALFAPFAASAQPPRDDRRPGGPRGDHPRYLQARSDLREAQALLRNTDDRRAARNLRAADRELDLAIREVESAASANGRNLDRNPPPSATYDQRGRFRRVMELTRTARQAIEQEEDNPEARVWRARAFRHIDAAVNFVRQGMVELRIEREGGF